MGELYDKLPERASAGSALTIGLEIEAAPLCPAVLGPPGIIAVLLSEVLHHREG